MEVRGQVDMPAAAAAVSSATAEYCISRRGDWVLKEVVVKSRQLNIPAESVNPVMHPANSYLTQLTRLHCHIQKEISAF